MTPYQKFKDGIGYCSQALNLTWKNPILFVYFGALTAIKTSIELLAHNAYHAQLHFKTTQYLQSILVNTVESNLWLNSVSIPVMNLFSVVTCIIAGFCVVYHVITLIDQTPFSRKKLINALTENRWHLLQWMLVVFTALCILALSQRSALALYNPYFSLILLGVIGMLMCIWKLLTSFVLQVMYYEQTSLQNLLSRSKKTAQDYFYQYCGVLLTLGMLTIMSIGPQLIAQKLLVYTQAPALPLIILYGLTIFSGSILTTLFTVTKTVLYHAYRTEQLDNLYDKVPVPPL